MLNAAVGHLSVVADRAVETLACCLEADNESTKVAAARAILTQLLALRSAAETEERLIDLEEAVEVLLKEKANAPWRQNRSA
jgi:hypothetical protein